MTHLITPTVQQVSDSITNQIAAAISQSVPLLPKGFTRVVAKALGGVFILVYKYAGFSLLQFFVTHASARDTVVNGKTINPLTEWGAMVGVGKPNDAERWEGTGTVVVLNQSGSLPAGSQLLRSQTGVLYLTLSAVTLDAPTKTITIRASSDQQGNGGAGTLGNLNVDDVISFANPQPNVAQDVSVLSETTTGADAEDTEVYRQRILDRIAAQPQGGAYADYRTWAQDVAGVINIYPYTGDPGEVDVYSEVDASIDEDGFPPQATLDAVRAAIELDVSGVATNRPANAWVNSFSIERTPFIVEVSGLLAPDETEARSAINSSVDSYLRSREPFIVGLSRSPRVDQVTQGGVGGIVHAAAATLGATVVSVVVKRALTTISAYTLQSGEKAKLGGVTYL